MAYIQYNDDPLKKRVSDAFANLCATTTSGKKSLRAFDKTLSVFNGSKIDAAFSLEDFIFPVDTQNAINFEICPGESLSLFDNQLENITPISLNSFYPVNHPLGQANETIEPIGVFGPSSLPAYYLLSDAKSYARGILLHLAYSITSADGSDTLVEDAKANLTISTMIDDNGVYTENVKTFPIYSFFANFSNPQTVSASALINSIVLENPSDSLDTGGYCITVTGLVLYTKSSIDVSACTC